MQKLLTVRIEEELHQKLRLSTVAHETTVAEIVRKSLEEWLVKNPAPTGNARRAVAAKLAKSGRGRKPAATKSAPAKKAVADKAPAKKAAAKPAAKRTAKPAAKKVASKPAAKPAPAKKAAAKKPAAKKVAAKAKAPATRRKRA